MVLTNTVLAFLLSLTGWVILPASRNHVGMAIIGFVLGGAFTVLAFVIGKVDWPPGPGEKPWRVALGIVGSTVFVGLAGTLLVMALVLRG